MRLLSLSLVFCLLCLLPSFALAKPIQVAVGKKSTWVNLETGDRRVRGRPLGRIEIDTSLLREKCVRAAEAFDGFVRLRPETRSDGWIVRVECMWRAQPTTESETAQPIVAAPAADLQVPSFSAEPSPPPAGVPMRVVAGSSDAQREWAGVSAE